MSVRERDKISEWERESEREKEGGGGGGWVRRKRET